MRWLDDGLRGAHITHKMVTINHIPAANQLCSGCATSRTSVSLSWTLFHRFTSLTPDIFKQVKMLALQLIRTTIVAEACLKQLPINDPVPFWRT
ncbi:hypothetical protein PAXRUDRAFT_828669 [Paxillus rubicundulus Ve08.2h10]|uniref:Uncharacterized protein n=1 Tax=Paxillus rubicundulus Ve08.2h10 TaxID=930991 RepID=A0A0D0E100_9AGAM|nr:hypothetical protein PAXRUDRAFT_828669 [Paxillus rubicundulus Ve08.2h10]